MEVSFLFAIFYIGPKADTLLDISRVCCTELVEIKCEALHIYCKSMASPEMIRKPTAYMWSERRNDKRWWKYDIVPSWNLVPHVCTYSFTFPSCRFPLKQLYWYETVAGWKGKPGLPIWSGYLTDGRKVALYFSNWISSNFDLCFSEFSQQCGWEEGRITSSEQGQILESLEELEPVWSIATYCLLVRVCTCVASADETPLRTKQHRINICEGGEFSEHWHREEMSMEAMGHTVEANENWFAAPPYMFEGKELITFVSNFTQKSNSIIMSHSPTYVAGIKYPDLVPRW